MESKKTHNPLLPPKGYKPAVYLRVNHSDKLDDGKQTNKTAIYCRVASTHPNDIGTIDLQLNKLRDFAAQQGFEGCIEYSDNGYRKRPKQTGFFSNGSGYKLGKN